VASFARPGGNLTGVNILVVTLNAKRLELLVEAVPAAKTVAVLTHPPPAKDFWLDAGVLKVAQDLGMELHQMMWTSRPADTRHCSIQWAA
jgi:ABC-type uncharacterized transport system substrate-binding protein